MASASTTAKDGDTLSLRDSYVPPFSNQPSDYREYRKRLNLYHKKMVISKRTGESVLNIIGSNTGVTWKLFEDFPIEAVEKGDAFSKILEKLDKNFEYDDRVLLPNDFEEYFNLLQRKPQQSLLAYVTEYDTAYRKLMSHNVSLPGQVQGWHLLRRAGLTREQRQIVTLKAPTLEKQNVIEALYLLYGQDYKAGGWNHDRDRELSRWKGRATPPSMKMMVNGLSRHHGTMKVPTTRPMNGLSTTACLRRRTPLTMTLVTMVKKSHVMSMVNQLKNLMNSLNNMIMPMQPTWTPGRRSNS